MEFGRLVKLLNHLRSELGKTGEDLPRRFPVDIYIECMKRCPEISSYRYLSSEIEKLEKLILEYSNEHALELYHQLILVELIIRAQDVLQKKPFSEEVCSFFEVNFARIVGALESKTHVGPDLYSNDRFCKDLAVCGLKLIPAGARKIHVNGLTRRFLIKAGPRQFIAGLYLALFKLGGFKPLYEMHLDTDDPHLMTDFNQNGLIRFYVRVAELLELDPTIKGICGSSWYHDPALDKISPRLSYLRKLPTENGAQIFYLGSDDSSIRNAILKSPTRKKLYEEGRYMPTGYLLVWPRNKLMAWAERLKRAMFCSCPNYQNETKKEREKGDTPKREKGVYP
jgi:hypothetical protein